MVHFCPPKMLTVKCPVSFPELTSEEYLDRLNKRLKKIGANGCCAGSMTVMPKGTATVLRKINDSKESIATASFEGPSDDPKEDSSANVDRLHLISESMPYTRVEVVKGTEARIAAYLSAAAEHYSSDEEITPVVSTVRSVQCCVLQ